ncbi:hypothetical protein [Desulfospira joergensenii]|uniref:hypothetical protein n=1 Tax=Desulfospira joergensenii TaxID=53329 RepID=UPI00041B4E4A|nr:hypothetical protein [Desulfospira joergensenii]
MEKAKEEASKEYVIRGARSGPDPSKGESDDSLSGPWIGVDLDGTLAVYDNSSSLDTVGEPVPAMVALVRKMINNGIRVKIFTARAVDPEQLPIIRKWLKTHQLPELEITNIKDYHMLKLYDDRAVQVEKNTGRLITDTGQE